MTEKGIQMGVLFLLQGKGNMANEQNLKPFREGEVSRELALKGQAASAKKRKENNIQRKAVMAILEDRLRAKGYADLDDAIDGLIDRAKDNDKAFELMLAIMGEKPKEQIEVSQDKPFEVTIEVIE